MTVNELIAELEDMRANGRGSQGVFLFREGDQVCLPVRSVCGHHKEGANGHVTIGSKPFVGEAPTAMIATAMIELDASLDEGEKHDPELMKRLVDEGLRVAYRDYLILMFKRYDRDLVRSTAARLAENLSKRRLSTTWVNL